MQASLASKVCPFFPGYNGKWHRENHRPGIGGGSFNCGWRNRAAFNIITDLFGFSLLVPPFVKRSAKSLTKSFGKKVSKATGFSHMSNGFSSFRKGSDDVIDV